MSFARASIHLQIQTIASIVKSQPKTTSERKWAPKKTRLNAINKRHGVRAIAAIRRSFAGTSTRRESAAAAAAAASPDGKEQLRTHAAENCNTGVKSAFPPNSTKSRGRARPIKTFRISTTMIGPTKKLRRTKSGLWGWQNRYRLGRKMCKPISSSIAMIMQIRLWRLKSLSPFKTGCSVRTKTAPLANQRDTARSIVGNIMKTKLTQIIDLAMTVNARLTPVWGAYRHRSSDATDK